MSLMNPERPGFLHEIEPQPQQEKGNCIGRNFILLFFLKKKKNNFIEFFWLCWVCIA